MGTCVVYLNFLGFQSIASEGCSALWTSVVWFPLPKKTLLLATTETTQHLTPHLQTWVMVNNTHAICIDGKEISNLITFDTKWFHLFTHSQSPCKVFALTTCWDQCTKGDDIWFVSSFSHFFIHLHSDLYSCDNSPEQLSPCTSCLLVGVLSLSLSLHQSVMVLCWSWPSYNLMQKLLPLSIEILAVKTWTAST